MLVAGSAVRLSYALGLLLAPHTMNRLQLAAETRGNGVATMTTRAFGAVNANIALLTLRSALAGRDIRLALGVNVAVDFGDLVATLLEWRDGDLGPAETVASVALQSAGIVSWTSLLRADHGSPAASPPGA
jgi:hypothetical protein